MMATCSRQSQQLRSRRCSSRRITLDLSASKSELRDQLEGPDNNAYLLHCTSVDIRYQAPPNGVIVPEQVDTIYDEFLHEQQQEEQEGRAQEDPDHDQLPTLDEVDAKEVDEADPSTSSAESLDSSLHSRISRETPAQRKLRRKQRKCRQRRMQLDGKLWYALGLLRDAAPHLKHVSIRLVGGTCPSEALAWLLNKAERLESLHIRTALHGDMPELVYAVQRHSTLNKVWLDHCRPYNHRAWEGEDPTKTNKVRHTSLEPILLEGLAKCQSLRELTMSQCHMILPTTLHLTENDLLDAPTWKTAGESLSQLVTTSKSLKKLSFEAMRGISDASLAKLAQSLEDSHSRLSTLSIRQCAVGRKTGNALGKMLARNRSLQTLDVNMQWFDALVQDPDTGEFQALCHESDPAAIVEGLRSNETLRCLGLYCDNVFSKHPDFVATAVNERANDMCEEAQQATVQIFEPDQLTNTITTASTVNCVLENLIIGHRERALSPEIDFYLEWNSAGRDFLRKHDDVTFNEWMYSIMRSDDLSVTFALVGMNPAMLTLRS